MVIFKICIYCRCDLITDRINRELFMHFSHLISFFFKINTVNLEKIDFKNFFIHFFFVILVYYPWLFYTKSKPYNPQVYCKNNLNRFFHRG